MTPPNARVDNAYRVKSGVRRVIPEDVAIPLTVATNYLIYVHLILEVYALWATSKQPPFDLQIPWNQSICPLAGPSTRSIYPASALPVSALISLCFIIFGGLFRSSCHHELGRMFTWETSILKNHKLVTTGPYRIVRHPSYTGFVVVVIGYTWFLFVPAGTFMRECLIGSDFPAAFTTKGTIGILYASGWAFLNIDTSFFLVRRTFVEDGMLRKEFGKEWDRWAQKVRWNVIPYVV